MMENERRNSEGKGRDSSIGAARQKESETRGKSKEVTWIAYIIALMDQNYTQGQNHFL